MEIFQIIQLSNSQERENTYNIQCQVKSLIDYGRRMFVEETAQIDITIPLSISSVRV